MDDTMQYFAAIDLENLSDGFCWYRAGRMDDIHFTRVEHVIDTGILQLRGKIFAAEKRECMDEEEIAILEKYIQMTMEQMSKDISRYSGGNVKKLWNNLCLALLVPCGSSEICLQEIRSIMSRNKAKHVRFITKEAAAVLYASNNPDFTVLENGTFLFLDAGETCATASVISVEGGTIRVLSHDSREGIGASALDVAFINYLIDYFGSVFKGFHTERIKFRKLLEEWMSKRITMKSETPVELDMNGFLQYAEYHMPKPEYQYLKKNLSQGFLYKLSLSVELICEFGRNAAEDVIRLCGDALDVTERNGVCEQELQIVINGSYLNNPLFDMYFHKMTNSKRFRGACMYGALAMFEKMRGMQLSGSLKRAWGVYLVRSESGTDDFFELLPGDKLLPVGYRTDFYLSPKSGQENRVEIYLYSLPPSWHQGYDRSEIVCEKVLRVDSPKTQFPKRKLRVSAEITDVLKLSVLDLTSQNMASCELPIEWNQAPDFIVELY